MNQAPPATSRKRPVNRGTTAAPAAATTPSSAALGEQDIHLFREGTHARLYRKLGCHLGAAGARFVLWAPNARAVSVIGDFNEWDAEAHRASARGDGSGLWEIEVAGVAQGQRYKFAIFTDAGERLYKAYRYATLS